MFLQPSALPCSACASEKRRTSVAWSARPGMGSVTFCTCSSTASSPASVAAADSTRSTSFWLMLIWAPKRRRTTSRQACSLRSRSRSVEMSKPVDFTCWANWSMVILLRSAMPCSMRLASSSEISTPSFLASCSLRRSSISSSCACLRNWDTMPVRDFAADLVDHVRLQLLDEIRLQGLRLLLRLHVVGAHEVLEALVGLGVLDDLRPARLGLGLHVLRIAAGVGRHEAGALLDLPGGDRLVVDEHDDGLRAFRGGAAGL